MQFVFVDNQKSPVSYVLTFLKLLVGNKNNIFPTLCKIQKVKMVWAAKDSISIAQAQWHKNIYAVQIVF